MKRYGVREVANVVFKAKANGTKIGNKVFKAGEPVIYFDTIKTSSVEGTSEAVYARGGRGNPKLVTWEGEKEMTFTFEDALISPVGLSILLGAGLGESADNFHHVKIKAIAVDDGAGAVSIDITDDLELIAAGAKIIDPTAGLTVHEKAAGLFVYETDSRGFDMVAGVTDFTVEGNVIKSATLTANEYYLVDGYVKVKGTSFSISPDKFADAFYIEAETLFRDEDQVDHAAQFVIPNGKVQSNFDIAMANSGDPSTFNFTIDAMADYTYFNKKKKVLCEITVLD